MAVFPNVLAKKFTRTYRDMKKMPNVLLLDGKRDSHTKLQTDTPSKKLFFSHSAPKTGLI